jgi:Xaa-Pro aminopeptidase
MEKLSNKDVRERRLVNFRKQLKEIGIDAALVTKRENYMYLSGFTGTSAHLLVSQEDAFLITDFRYIEQASIQAPLFKIVKYTEKVTDMIGGLLKDKKIGSLGFEEIYLTVEKYNVYKSAFQLKDFCPIGNVIEGLRMIKDSEEIDIISKAVEIADNAFTHVLSLIKPGIREIEIAAELEYYMKKQGAKGVSFETIVASGKRSAMPHGTASDKVLENKDAVTLDFGCIYEDYCSDMTRTVFLGEPGEEMKKVYGVVLEAQLKALEGACSGVKGKEVDSLARKIISDNGYGNNFGHGLGHGVGLEVHEEPRLSPAGEIKMEDGMVVTVEPGIYIPNLGGVRIEDMIVIDKGMPKVLTRSPKDIIVI